MKNLLKSKRRVTKRNARKIFLYLYWTSRPSPIDRIVSVAPLSRDVRGKILIARKFRGSFAWNKFIFILYAGSCRTPVSFFKVFYIVSWLIRVLRLFDQDKVVTWIQFCIDLERGDRETERKEEARSLFAREINYIYVRFSTCLWRILI